MSTKRKRRGARKEEFRNPQVAGAERQAASQGVAEAEPERGSGEAAPASPRRTSGARRAADERPAAPWGSFPLVELMVVVALILLAIGFFTEGRRGTTMIAVGLVLGSLAGLELAVREHFAGYRSHNMLLAGGAGVLTAAGLYFGAGLVLAACLGAGLVIGGAALLWLRSAFRKASGGLSFKAGGLRG